MEAKMMDTAPSSPEWKTLKEEAKHNVSRVDPLAKEFGANNVRLLVEPGIAALIADGEPDTRCSTCAYRIGTIPNSCLQTQADAYKAAMEGVPFLCHQHVNKAGEFDRVCHGWYAARVTLKGQEIKVPWPWVSDMPKEKAGD